MNGVTLVVSTVIVINLLIVSICLFFIRKAIRKGYRKRFEKLELELNEVGSLPIMLELSKVEPIIKNDKMEEKFNDWHDRFNHIKGNRLAVVNDMLIDLDLYIDKKDYNTSIDRLAKTELELYKVRESSDRLLSEIKEITLSEEKYRNIVIKLKTRYRELNKEFNDHRGLYDEIGDAITLQLENIEKRFLDFERVMEKNEYTEVVHIVKAIDSMIDHIGIVINEVPDLILMIKQIIPNRVKEINDTVLEMEEEGFPLGYLNIEYNINETLKNIEVMYSNVKILNLENCMFEMTTMLEYLDSLFVDFEKERLSRKVFEDISKDFSIKLDKANKLVKDVFFQLDDIKNMYDLEDKDIEIIHDVNKILVVINDDFNKLNTKIGGVDIPYSMLHKEIEELVIRLKTMEEEFDYALKSLGNMYDDEVRAREQLEEIQLFLKQCKVKVRSFKLPIISNNYFVQLAEANEAIEEVIKELEVKPIVIKTLNTRVDTARDLVLKIYNATNEMVKTARMAEQSIVYGNRYRSKYEDVNIRLIEAEELFYKGEYKKSLDIAIKATSLVDNEIYGKLLAVYDK